MKKEIKTGIIIKAGLLIFLVGWLVYSFKTSYECLSRSKAVRPELVESFRPTLNVVQVKKAAQILKD
ncbi:hypothetical protein ACFL0Y_00585 [Patescibacteria group bacterium]